MKKLILIFSLTLPIHYCYQQMREANCHIIIMVHKDGGFKLSMFLWEWKTWEKLCLLEWRMDNCTRLLKNFYISFGWIEFVLNYKLYKEWSQILALEILYLGSLYTIRILWQYIHFALMEFLEKIHKIFIILWYFIIIEKLRRNSFNFFFFLTMCIIPIIIKQFIHILFVLIV